MANVGDSEGFLFRKKELLPLIQIHKPDNKAEAKRVQAEGGHIFLNRLNGTLAVSRAFGDFGYIGAACATFCTYLIMSLFIIYKNKTWLPIKYDLKKIFILLCVSILILFLSINFTSKPALVDSNYFYVFLYLIFSIFYIKKSFRYPK